MEISNKPSLPQFFPPCTAPPSRIPTPQRTDNIIRTVQRLAVHSSQPPHQAQPACGFCVVIRASRVLCDDVEWHGARRSTPMQTETRDYSAPAVRCPRGRIGPKGQKGGLHRGVWFCGSFETLFMHYCSPDSSSRLLPGRQKASILGEKQPTMLRAVFNA